MRDSRGGSAESDGSPSNGAVWSIDGLVERAVEALNRGDLGTATALADQVLTLDHTNSDAGDLLSFAPGKDGEIRRLTILFADLVDSTVLSTRVEPEAYRVMVGRYRDIVQRMVQRYEGHIGSVKGDGLLAVFGHPNAHENDVQRAVRAGLEITRAVVELSGQTLTRFGVEINVRIGVHRGLVYLDTAQDDVYGLAANLAARVSGLALPGELVVSEPVALLVGKDFELEDRAALPVKGLDELIAHRLVKGERFRPAGRSRTPIVGREHELNRLVECCERARVGSNSTQGLMFCGEPGIGKTRLAEEAAEIVRRCGGTVLELSGSSFHADVGLHPVRALIERRCGITRLTTGAERLRLLESEVASLGLDSRATVSALAPVLGIGHDSGYERPLAEGRRLEELIAFEVRAYLLACLNAAPALLIAEDVHWFDQSTTALVRSVLDSETAWLLVVLTSRDDSCVPLDWEVERCDLEPLSSEHADRLIVAIDPAIGEIDRAEIRRRCDGVPYFIENLVSAMQWMPAEGAPSVPDTLYEPLFARLRTNADAVPLMEAAAVIGRDIDPNLLIAVVDLDEARVEFVIGAMVDARVLELTSDGTWRFRHELLREVALELAPPSVRRRLHAKVADALVRNSAEGEPDWPLIAAHYEKASQHSDAASAFERASATARMRGALAEARTYLTYSLEQIERCPDGPERDRREISARLERGHLVATAEGAQSPLAAADFERCLQLVLSIADNDDLLFAATTAVGSYLVWRADLLRARQLVDGVEAAIGHGRRMLDIVTKSSAGTLAWLSGDFDTARALLHLATADLSTDDERRIRNSWFVPHDPVATAHEHLAWDRLVQGDLAAADEHISRSVRRAERLGYPQGPCNRLYAIDMEIWIRAESGQYDSARALVDTLIELSERFGFDRVYWQLLGATERALVEGQAALAKGNYDRADLSSQIDNLTHIIEFWQKVGASTYRPLYWCLLGRLLTAQGEQAKARLRLDAALEFAADSGVRFYNVELLRARAATHSDPDAHAADLAAARNLARGQKVPLFELRVALDDFELRGEPARDDLTKAVAGLPSDCSLPEVARAMNMLS